MKNHKVSGYLVGMFIASMLCTGTAWAGPGGSKAKPSYEWLECKPIPDKLTILYPDGNTTKLLENPTARDLTHIRQNGETIIEPITITKPSIYILCEVPGVLLRDCYNEILKNPAATSLNHGYVPVNIRTNIYTIFSDSIGPFNEFNLSGRIAGSNRHETENAVVHRPWSLAKSEGFPDYWRFNGVVEISLPQGVVAAVNVSPPEYRKYNISEHYYTCKLESDNNLDSLRNKLKVLDEDNRKYIR